MNSTVPGVRLTCGALDGGNNVGCPSCGSHNLFSFYEQVEVPVDSCRLLDERAKAKSFPCGSVRLAFCKICGFITNAAFDPSVQDYSASYEEVQGFSPRFQEFTESLAWCLIEKYDLRGKDILEIGCGRGDFLALICQLGGNRGIGIDPCLCEGQIGGALGGDISFIKDYYSEGYAHLAGDFVICRHTLEHIQPVGEFIRLLRRTLAGRPETVVFFEVPDMRRIIRQAAFWDIYYEHCSYFTCGSLARLFRMMGFEVLGLALDYEDQYILIECRPSQTNSATPLELEEQPAELTQAVMEFQTRYADNYSYWKRILGFARQQGQRVVIWGSGSKAGALLKALGLEDVVEYVVNINHYQHGRYVVGTGQQMVSPEFLRHYQPDFVINMNPVYHDEIAQTLQDLGVETNLLVV